MAATAPFSNLKPMRVYRCFAAGLLLAALCACAPAQKWRLIVTGDDRWNTNAPRPGLDKDGVNVTGLAILNKAIIAEHPNLLLISGDTVGGAESDAEQTSQFKTWMDVMKPVYDSDIKVLVVRGNHEMHCPHSSDIWRSVFSGKFQNPGGGPAGEEDMTFALNYQNAVIIGFDQFFTEKPKVNQPWLDQVLAANKKPHIFLFAHKMAFEAGNHDDGMELDPAARDAFWNSIAKAGGRTYFCGHDHYYDHASVTGANLPQDKAIHQFIVGTAGAPFVKGNKPINGNGSWTVNHLSHVENRLGYVVVDVDGDKATLTFKGQDASGAFVPMDTWSYTATHS